MKRCISCICIIAMLFSMCLTAAAASVAPEGATPLIGWDMSQYADGTTILATDGTKTNLAPNIGTINKTLNCAGATTIDLDSGNSWAKIVQTGTDAYLQAVAQDAAGKVLQLQSNFRTNIYQAANPVLSFTFKFWIPEGTDQTAQRTFKVPIGRASTEADLQEATARVQNGFVTLTDWSGATTSAAILENDWNTVEWRGLLSANETALTVTAATYFNGEQATYGTADYTLSTAGNIYISNPIFMQYVASADTPAEMRLKDIEIYLQPASAAPVEPDESATTMITAQDFSTLHVTDAATFNIAPTNGSLTTRVWQHSAGQSIDSSLSKYTTVDGALQITTPPKDTAGEGQNSITKFVQNTSSSGVSDYTNLFTAGRTLAYAVDIQSKSDAAREFTVSLGFGDKMTHAVDTDHQYAVSISMTGASKDASITSNSADTTAYTRSKTVKYADDVWYTFKVLLDISGYNPDTKTYTFDVTGYIDGGDYSDEPIFTDVRTIQLTEDASKLFIAQCIFAQTNTSSQEATVLVDNIQVEVAESSAYDALPGWTEEAYIYKPAVLQTDNTLSVSTKTELFTSPIVSVVGLYDDAGVLLKTYSTSTLTDNQLVLFGLEIPEGAVTAKVFTLDSVSQLQPYLTIVNYTLQ